MTDWEQRQLCPDGACVGVIGADGTCKVCGRAAPNWGNERTRGLVDEPEAAAEDAGPPADDLADQPGEPSVSAEDDSEWGGRKLCPDGACVGVIGDDGTCKVCGRTAA